MSAPVLFQIASDLTKMQINASVAEADVGSVEEGQEVEFTVDAFPTRTFVGRVTQVRNSPLTVQNVVTYDTVIEVNNADLRLKPGMTANVSIIVQQRDNVLRLPNGALRVRPPEDYVLPAETNQVTQGTSFGPGATNATAGGSNILAAVEGQSPRRGGPGGPGFGPGGRGGGGRGGIGGGGRGARGGERRMAQTVYVLPAGVTEVKPGVKLKPVRIRLGITDGIWTEVVEGLNENDVIVTGSSVTTAAAGPGGQNPFSGGGPRGRRF
jgi:HlyD family secretion protein